MPAADTIPRRILDQARRRPASHAYFAKQAGVWRPTTWRHYVDEIRTAARALIALGLPRGGKVAILGFNRPEWVIFDHAAMMAGGVPAGIYTTCSAEEVQYIVHHCEAHVVLVEDLGQWKKIAAQKSNLPLLRHVVTMKGCPPIDDPMVLSWEAFLAKAAPIRKLLRMARSYRTRSPAEQQRHRARSLVGHGQVGHAVAVEVADDHVAGIRPGDEVLPGSEGR